MARIAVLPGDGIGKEVTDQAVRVLQAAATDADRLQLDHALIGACAIEREGVALPPATLELARDADAILFGAVGGPLDELPDRSRRPGTALLTLRRELGLFANYRPAFLFPELIGASSLRPEVVDGLDLVILRELNGDLYFGEPRGIVTDEQGRRSAFNTMRYNEDEIARIARAGFELARGRKRRLCSVDKANVLETMHLWREVVTQIGAEFPDVELSHLYVDAATMALMRAPTRFDVIVTGNVFGDILSDAAAMLTGSIGMLPSASIGADGRKGLYEPVHGSAPDIAGRNIASPLASILSAAMMLRMSLQDEDGAARIERAVRQVLADGFRTADILEQGRSLLGTREMADAVIAALGTRRG